MMNWSYAVARVTKNGVSSKHVLLTDLDSLAINVKLLLFGYDKSDPRPFAYLNDYVIDVENMRGFVNKDVTAKSHVMVIRTKDNDRRRSRLSSQRGNGFDFTFVNNQKDRFAKDYAEFATEWEKTYNDKKLATPRQVLSGLQQFMELQVDRLVRPH